MVATTKHHLLFYSNTTLVKVKSKRNMESYIYGLIQIQHLLKLNMYIIAYCIACNPIQIQHLLKLNYCLQHYRSFTIHIQIQHLLKLNL